MKKPLEQKEKMRDTKAGINMAAALRDQHDDCGCRVGQPSAGAENKECRQERSKEGNNE